MPKFTPTYTLLFSTVLCALLALAVAGAAAGLRPFQEANERRDLHGKILGALGVTAEGGAPLVGEAIDAAWDARVAVIVVDDAGKVVEGATLESVAAEVEAADSEGREPRLHAVYQRKDGDAVGAYAIEMSGMGLWGPIWGYLAIAPDGVTVTGATFFAPKETPGLGYEITAADFTDQWVGRKIYGGGKPKPIRVIKTEVAVECPGDEAQHCVDGISGSTLTGRGVEAMVADAVETYEPWLKTVRGGT